MISTSYESIVCHLLRTRASSCSLYPAAADSWAGALSPALLADRRAGRAARRGNWPRDEVTAGVQKVATPGAGSSRGGGRFGSANLVPSARCAVVHRDAQRAPRKILYDTGASDGCTDFRPGFENVFMMRDGAAEQPL